ncbi:MAG TPA: Holliday junction branch migration protein RuvA [Methylomirabilota bacterium]|nr:Holliday junction branch migration protein RuvA [Methylomirabilota bacterium]
MIAALRGTLLERGDGFVVVEAGGVGYQVHVTTGTIVSLPAVGEEVRLHTRHIVREDAQLLFGFADRDELKLFDLLIAVNGVGPRIGIAVLSGLSPVRFAAAVRDENLGAITAVPGVGRKTAERLVVELRDKLGFLPAMPAAAASSSEPRASKTRVLAKNERHEDAVAALVTLGYTVSQATDAVSRVAEEAADAPAVNLVKRALAVLVRPTLVTR